MPHTALFLPSEQACIYYFSERRRTALSAFYFVAAQWACTETARLHESKATHCARGIDGAASQLHACLRSVCPEALPLFHGANRAAAACTTETQACTDQVTSDYTQHGWALLAAKLFAFFY